MAYIVINLTTQSCEKMKGFRNFLVHRYGGIDDKVAFEVIKGGLEDFSEFIEEIEAFFTKMD